MTRRESIARVLETIDLFSRGFTLTPLDPIRRASGGTLGLSDLRGRDVIFSQLILFIGFLRHCLGLGPCLFLLPLSIPLPLRSRTVC
jgi:hypothetical protein